MEKKRLTGDALRGELSRLAIRYTLTQGQGAALVFLWTIGLALFVLVLKEMAFLFAWTAAIAGLVALAARDALRNRTLQRALLRSFIGKRYPPQALADASLREVTERGKGLFAEIALKVVEIAGTRGRDPELGTVLADTDDMIRFQRESARRAEEFDRALKLVGPRLTADEGSPTARSGGKTLEQRDENVKALQGEAARARRLAGEILQQLEILLMQLFQLERRAVDVVESADFARETELLLGRIQSEVEAQATAAKDIIEMFGR